MPRGLKLHLAVLAAYVAVVLCVLGPLHPGQQVWGGGTNDVVNYLGNLVWQAREAAGGSPVSRHSTMLLFPDGGAIWPPDLLGGTLILPVVWLAGPLWAYNLLVLADLVFACWAMFWLARRLSGGDLGVALLCGAVYGLAPVTLGHVNNGIIEQLATGWLPLFVGALHRLADDAAAPAGRKATALAVLAAAAAWWAASVSSHWYHGAYAGLLFGLLLLALGAAHWRRTGRAPLGLAWRGAAALALFVVLVLPVVAWFITPYQSDASLMRALDRAPTLDTPEVNADLAYLLAPRPPIVSGEESFLHLAYLGFSVPLLALLGLVRTGRRRVVGGWLALALFWAALALGPRLVAGGQFVDADGGGVSMPFAWLARVLPFFGRMDFPYRCVLVAHLALAAAAAVGLGGLWRDRPWRRPALAGVLAVALLETALWSGVVVPAPRATLAPRGPMHLLATGDDTAVLDLPLRLRPDDSRRFAVNQLFHRRPIPYTSFITARKPLSPTLAREHVVISLLHAASAERGPPPGSVPMHWRVFHGQMAHRNLAAQALPCISRDGCPPFIREALARDVAALARRGVGHVALHTDLLPSGSLLPAVCAGLFGPPVGKADRVWVYRLRSGAK